MTVGGLVFLVLGIALYFLKAPMGLNRKIYDLPVFLIIIGVCFAIRGFMAKEKTEEEAALAGKTFTEFLTNNAILLAMLVLVVVICILQPRFMQIRVALDILTQSSPKLIMALGICFALLIAGTDLSAGRMVGLAAVISASMMQTATYANRFFPDLPQVSVWIPIVAAVIACMLFGALNGFLVAKYEMHPFIATLATQVII